MSGSILASNIFDTTQPACGHMHRDIVTGMRFIVDIDSTASPARVLEELNRMLGHAFFRFSVRDARHVIPRAHERCLEGSESDAEPEGVS